MDGVINRAWLAAEVYGQESLEKLAQVYCLLGCVDGSADPERSVPSHPAITALALFTFITLKGMNEEALDAQVDRRRQKGFWRTVYEGTRERGRAICETLEDWLQNQGVSQEKAYGLIRPLRKDYGVDKR